MPIRQRGTSYQLDLKQDGHPRIRMSFGSLEAAEGRQRDILRRYHATGEWPSGTREVASTVPMDQTKPDTLGSLLHLAMKVRWSSLKSGQDLYENGRRVVDLIGASKSVATVTVQTIDSIVEAMKKDGNSGSTINRKLAALSVLLGLAEERGYVSRRVRLPRQPEGEHRIRWMDDTEEQAFLALLEHAGLKALREYVIVAIDTGFRRGEMLGLSPRDYTKGAPSILSLWVTKGGVARSIPLSTRAEAVIVGRLDRAKLFDDFNEVNLRAQWEQARRLFGKTTDEQFVVHMLRHTCCTRLVQDGHPLPVVKAWMGHSEITTTMRYAHLAPQQLADVAVRMNARHSGWSSLA